MSKQNPDPLRRRSINLFRSWFSFEEDIDITDDVWVLYRRNIVIKNIILLSNLVYTFILFIITLGSPEQGGNWILSVISLPLTFMINKTLKRMIYDDAKSLIKQQIAMYMASFYMFLSAVLIYLKLKSGADIYLSEAGYILLYYSVVVVSLYQDKRLMMTIFRWMLVLITIIHFTITYQIYNREMTVPEFLRAFYSMNEFKDILLRTLIFIIFMMVIYSIVSIGQYMQEERKNELVKRRSVQEDFTHIVSDIFGVVLNLKVNLEDRRHAILVSDMAERMAGTYGLPPKTIEEIVSYAKIHVTERDQIKLDEYSNRVLFEESDYNELKKKTEHGARVIKRLQLQQKCEDIARAHIEGYANDAFVDQISKIQTNIESQIILLSDLYITLRSGNTYKRPYSHKFTMESFEKEFKKYFDPILYERFSKWQHDFEAMYNQY